MCLFSVLKFLTQPPPPPPFSLYLFLHSFCFLFFIPTIGSAVKFVSVKPYSLFLFIYFYFWLVPLSHETKQRLEIVRSSE
ncbi:hypothetical protein BX661DRAFT_18523 [Kickxella alabastrina]|uniref:uncharacterized protein n=1 Tax=Kickxella alabastrina TaxID=61397 RepID=UPI00221EEBDC|nr:uncharacterized protein BX661DRAFT_18523 [Kickxella alabastrina]KAI7827881.1 hypothetical protein BX661DRAFT_18523 [Kickxella alabastrina]